jgi:hypothetical protein
MWVTVDKEDLSIAMEHNILPEILMERIFHGLRLL